jgi:dipeptidyl aminopeptidase/acylaminoacyl peptidase
LAVAKAYHKTKIVSAGDQVPAPDSADGSPYELITYKSAVGDLAAYVTRDPGDGQKHAAIIWITGGDCNSIGDVWSPQPRENDQSASGFRNAGIVMMFPSLRGGNENPGKREGFYGEVDDVIAAREKLASLPYVDANRIYLGGHSTGGTLAMLVGESTDAFAGVFSLGPVAGVVQYGGEFVYCEPTDEGEMQLRSPVYWLNDVHKPMLVFEGGDQGNWKALELMQEESKNSNIKFFRIPNHNHFSVIAPLSELLADRILSGNLAVTDADLATLK